MMKVGINVCFPIWYSCCIHYKTHINRVYLTKYILYLPIRLQKTVDTYRIFCEYETSFARGHDVSLDDIQRKATSSICMYSKEKNILFFVFQKNKCIVCKWFLSYSSGIKSIHLTRNWIYSIMKTYFSELSSRKKRNVVVRSKYTNHHYI